MYPLVYTVIYDIIVIHCNIMRLVHVSTVVFLREKEVREHPDGLRVIDALMIFRENIRGAAERCKVERVLA